MVACPRASALHSALDLPLHDDWHRRRLNFDFLNEPDPVPAPKPEPVPEPAVPSPLQLPEGLELGEIEEPHPRSLMRDRKDRSILWTTSPDAVPNISDGGTEILARGRAELQEFEEQFSAASEPAPAVHELTLEPAPVKTPTPEPVTEPHRCPSLSRTGFAARRTVRFRGGEPSEASPPTVTGLTEPDADTAVTISPLPLPRPTTNRPPPRRRVPACRA